jgi:hypothetical protein
VQQHLGRQVGVQKVEVSLRDGTVEVTPKEDGQVDPAQLMKATYDSGVTVAEMDMTARGRIVKDAAGRLGLEVAPNQTFSVVPNEISGQLESLVGSDTHVIVRGQLYKKAAGAKKQKELGPLKLVILEIQAKE